MPELIKVEVTRVKTPTIRNDKAGLGHFGANRGSRKHRGIDYVVQPGCQVYSPATGKVTKIGYCYRDDSRWRYVQITDEKGLDWRVFYISPDANIGDEVDKHLTAIGWADDITERYPDKGMTPHIHLEVKQGKNHLDPNEV